MDRDREGMLWIIAVLVLIALIAYLDNILRGLGEMFSSIMSGFAVLLGTATATTIAIPSFVLTIQGIAMTMVGFYFSQKIVHEVRDGIDKKPEIIITLMSFLIAFFIDISKDIIFPTNLSKSVFAFSLGIIFFFGSILCMQKKVGYKILGTIIYFIPISISVAYIILDRNASMNFIKELIASGLIGQIGLVFVLGFSLFLWLFSLFYAKKS